MQILVVDEIQPPRVRAEVIPNGKRKRVYRSGRRQPREVKADRQKRSFCVDEVISMVITRIELTR